jgi:hypothetical protein
MKKMMRYTMAAAVLAISAQAHSGLIEPTCSIEDGSCRFGNKGVVWRSGALPEQTLLSSASSANPELIPPPAFDELSPAYSHLVQGKGSPSLPEQYARCGPRSGAESCSGTAALDQAAAVPAPATLALMVLGLAGLLTQRRSGR